MEILDIPENYDGRKLKYAGFWIRTAAFIIDSIVLTFLWIATIAAMVASFFKEEEVDDLTLVLIVYSVLFVLQFFYFTFMESSENQATLGKMALGIKIGNKTGNRISFATAVGRYFSKILSAIIFSIGFFMAGWDERKQCLHDKLADTFVFYK